MSALALYGRGLASGQGEWTVRSLDGSTRPLALTRYLGTPAAEEETVLDRARGPVLDVGCGPGRHVLALAHRGVVGLGVDVSPAAVQIARTRGAPVIQRSVFDRVPGAGQWGSALLLDGNIGIGGEPAALLERVAMLLAPRGCALVEAEAPGAPTLSELVRIESPEGHSEWFPWARVAVDALGELTTELSTSAVWCANGRWFAELERYSASASCGSPAAGSTSSSKPATRTPSRRTGRAGA